MAQHGSSSSNFFGFGSGASGGGRRGRRRSAPPASPAPPSAPPTQHVTQHVAQARWSSADAAARQAAQVIQTVQEAIARMRRYDITIWPAPLTHLQALWFHPLTVTALQVEGGAVSHHLRLAGLILALVWVNPLTKRVCLLYNDDVLTHQRDPDLMQTLSRCFLPLGAQGDLERQRCYREEEETPDWRRQAIRAVPVWGIMLVGDRPRISLIGYYPLAALQAHWAGVHQHWLDIQPYSERATMPSLPIWREARGS